MDYLTFSRAVHQQSNQHYASITCDLLAFPFILHNWPSNRRSSLPPAANHAYWLVASRTMGCIRAEPVQDRQKNQGCAWEIATRSGSNNMSAPDRHWLLIKQYWHPIEELLKEASPDIETSQEQIDRLTGRLDASVIQQLHRLRIARNDVIHGNKPLSDALAFENAAISAAQALQGLLGRKSDTQRSEEDRRIRVNLVFWAMAFLGAYTITRGFDSSNHAPLPWRAISVVYEPLVWLVRVVIDVRWPSASVISTVAALSVITTIVPRSLEFALRIYLLIPMAIVIAVLLNASF